MVNRVFFVGRLGGPLKIIQRRKPLQLLFNWQLAQHGQTIATNCGKQNSITVSAFLKQRNCALQQLRKGQLIFIDGKVNYSEWEEDGVYKKRPSF